MLLDRKQMMIRRLHIVLLVLVATVPVAAPMAAQESTPDVLGTVTDCSTLLPRPQLSGPERTRENARFVIHYTTEGDDQVTTDDVDTVQAIMDAVIQIQIEDMGWPMPPPDCGEGGDSRFDIYLTEADDSPYASENTRAVVGYTTAEGLLGDNPNTPETEQYAAYSFMVLDSDFLAEGEDGRRLVYATAAHEFHHAVQNGYDLDDSLLWYYEATSTWMETQTFPQEQEATRYVPVLFYYPDLCIGAQTDKPGGQDRVYAEWLLIDSLAQDYGPEAIQRLWQLIAVDEGMAAFYHLLEELGTTPQAVMQRFAIRNLLLDYALRDEFTAQVRVEAIINGVGILYPQQTGVQELGVDYVRVAKPGVYTLNLNLPNLALVVVGIDWEAGTARLFELGGQGTVDTTPFSDAYVLVLNTAIHDDPAHCTWAGWTLTIADGTGQTPAVPLDTILDATHFIPPE
jgi:hypothetical protein